MEATSAKHGQETLDFEAIYREHYQQLFSFGYHLCANKEMAKDAIQEVFLIMWERRDKINEIDHLSAYLRKVTHRQVVKRIKEANKFSKHDDDRNLEIPTASYEDLVIGLEIETDQRNLLKRALELLSTTEKEMLRLKYFKSMNYDQIAEQTGKSKQTIYNQVFKAIGKLKTALNPMILLPIVDFFFSM